MNAPDNNTKASLGCGSLILIAIIVLIFSNGKNDELETELRETRDEIRNLNSKVEEQSATLVRIEAALKEANRKISVPRPRVIPQPPSE